MTNGEKSRKEGSRGEGGGGGEKEEVVEVLMVG